MIGTAIAVLAVAALATGFIIAPLLHKSAAEADPASASLGRARELQAEKEMLVASLRDLEDDRATDKIGDEDYALLQARLSSRAIAIMQQLDGLAEERSDAEEAAREASRPLSYPGKPRSGQVR